MELIYYVRTGQLVQRVVQAFEMRWYTKPELEHLLVRSGFKVEETFGDFDRSNLRDESREIVVIASLEADSFNPQPEAQVCLGTNDN